MSTNLLRMRNPSSRRVARSTGRLAWASAIVLLILLPYVGRAQAVLLNGANQTGLLAQVNQVDVWTFTASTGDALTISVANAGNSPGFAPQARVFAPDGTGLLSVSGGIADIGTVQAPQSGTYRVEVRNDPNIPNGTGAYILRLARAPASFTTPQGDDGGTLSNGADHAGAITPGDLDIWQFDAQAGDALTLSVAKTSTDPLGQNALLLAVYGPTGTGVTSAGGGTAGVTTVAAPTTGTYTVVVSPHFNIPQSVGTYILRLARAPAPFTTPQGDEGGTISNGENHAGTITAGDLDIWRFDAQAGDALTLSVAKTSTDPQGQNALLLAVYGPTGTSITSAGGGTADVTTVAAPTTGTYTVVVRPHFNIPQSTGTYILRLARAPASFTTPQGDDGGALVNGANHAGTISPGDLDIWQFDAQAGDALTLSVAKTSTDPQGQNALLLAVYGPTGTSITSAGGGTAAITAVAAPATGTYTVVVRPHFNIPQSTGTYILRLALAPAPTPPVVGDEGGRMANGALHAGTIDPGDLDLWYFDAAQGSQLSILLTETSADPQGQFSPLALLWGPNATSLASFVGQATLTAPQSGRYWLLVRSNTVFAGGTGTYTISATGIIDPPVPFTYGNVVVYRVGDGAGALVNTGSRIFLDEYTAAGVLVRSLPLPTTTSGANRRLVASGTATSEGFLTRSSDGLSLVLTGYDAAIPTTGLVTTTGTAVPRVVARVSADGSIDSSTALSDFASTSNPRGAATTNGLDLWVTGGAGGVRYAPLGATTSTQLSATVANLRQTAISNGQLFVSASSGAIRLGTVGAGLPTTAGQTITNLPSFPTTGSPYGFFFADLSPAVSGDDTVYVSSDDAAALQKYSLIGGAWVSNGFVGVAADAYRGLTGTVSGTAVTLFATRNGGSGGTGGGQLVRLIDSGGYNAPFSSTTPTVLATAATNTAFRGVALAPGAPVAVPTVSLALSTTSASEAAATAVTVTANSSAPVIGAQTVSIAVSGAGITTDDYTLTSTTITIPNGATSGAVTFTVVDDPFVEGAETATLTISLLSGGVALGNPIALDLSIVDNDIPAGNPPTIGVIAPLSGVALDPTNPTTTVTVGDVETPAGSLVVTATATTNPGVAPLANVSITGSGATRTIAVTPADVGYADITIMVTDSAGTSAATVLRYAASAASMTPATTRYHTGASDASTAVAVDALTMIVANDADQVLRIYNRLSSGGPIAMFDFTSSLGLTDISGSSPREVDIEASTVSGSRLYWIGSHGNSTDGAARPNRQRLFATDISGSGTLATLTYGGRYDHLRADLIAWDNANGHGLGTGYFGLQASVAVSVSPEAADGSGFNIEGLTMAPDGTTAYVAFRAPRVPVPGRAKALIVPITNFAALISPTGGVAGTAVFGAPIQLDLGGRAIRSVERNGSNE